MKVDKNLKSVKGIHTQTLSYFLDNRSKRENNIENADSVLASSKK